MRAGRLVTLMLLLQHRGRLTAGELATELEVSVRTVLRDIEALSGAGVAVYSTRGRSGGFELLEGFHSELVGPDDWEPQPRRSGRARRATVRISPEGRRTAALLQILQPIRVRQSAAEPGRKETDREETDRDETDRDETEWCEATLRIRSFESTARDMLTLGPEIEVLEPLGLRERVAAAAQATALLYTTR